LALPGLSTTPGSTLSIPPTPTSTHSGHSFSHPTPPNHQISVNPPMMDTNYFTTQNFHEGFFAG
jgi:hypothetical protein